MNTDRMPSKVPSHTSTYEHWHESDQRALTMTRLIVAKIDQDPSLVQVGVENMKRWRLQRAGYQPLCLDEWEELIVTEPWERLRERLLDPSDEGQRLRSSHPFAGILTRQERESVYPFDFERLRRQYTERTGKLWPTSPETLPGQRCGQAE